MSECPNCGSAGDHMPHGEQCRINEAVRDAVAEREELIRSLREELAEAEAGEAQSELDLLQVIIGRDEALSLVSNLRADLIEARDAERDQIADHLELRASKLEDELAISETSSEVGLERMLAVIKSLRREAQAIRNNEHRSNT